jgi:hypothetical protein
MPVFFGIILGVFLTVGFAYVYDASTADEPGTVQSGVAHKPMVNWDVASRNWHGWTANVKTTWNKLAAHKID